MALFIQFLLDEKFDKLYAHRLGFIHTGGKMTPEDLRVLIEAGENLEVEFKEEVIIYRRQLTGVWGRRPPIYDSEGLNRSNRSR